MPRIQPSTPELTSFQWQIIHAIPCRMRYADVFWMPVPVKITGRISSITNAFINSIIPSIAPTEEEIAKSLNILGLEPTDLRCAYCNDKASEWDHLRPLVIKQRPTGYISEIRNLVPACGKCNQSKGNKSWKNWIVSNARQSPKTRGISNLEQKIKRLEEYEIWDTPTPLDLENLVGEELWKKHWDNWRQLVEVMKNCNNHAQQVAERLRAAQNSRSV